MRSWIFRHRQRLRAIYGPRPQLDQKAGARPPRPRATIDGLRPGECARRGEWFVIRPPAA
jgi:hypothetical protein